MLSVLETVGVHSLEATLVEMPSRYPGLGLTGEDTDLGFITFVVVMSINSFLK